MSRKRESPKIGKSESQEDKLKAERPKRKAAKKSEVESPKPESQEITPETNSIIDIPQFEIQNKSETAQLSLTPIKNKQQLKIENPTSEIKNKSEIEHPQSEIKTMEVHHHPDLHHQPKAWKEYVLEGLMIFLAVMMGFFAESIRENISDNEHVAQLCSQLIQDMKTDTINLNIAISNETGYMKADDSLFAAL